MSKCKCHCHQGNKLFNQRYTISPKHFKSVYCAACSRGEVCEHCSPKPKPKPKLPEKIKKASLRAGAEKGYWDFVAREKINEILTYLAAKEKEE